MLTAMVIIGQIGKMSYYELWNILSQWKEEFTTREFASTFASPDHNKVLHDMSKKGLLEKTDRHKYRVIPQKEYVKMKADIPAAYDAVKISRLPYSFTGPDAVFFWTRGGYNADRFFGFYPVILRVRRGDLRKWQNFFRSRKKKWMIQGKPVKETLYGIFYYLQPVEKLTKTGIEGYSVDRLNDTIKFCKENPYTYEPALEMLDEMYDLGLGFRYREFK